jgi:hypothetical protein
MSGHSQRQVEAALPSTEHSGYEASHTIHSDTQSKLDSWEHSQRQVEKACLPCDQLELKISDG